MKRMIKKIMNVSMLSLISAIAITVANANVESCSLFMFH